MKLKGTKSETQQILIELRLIRNELKKQNATLDDIHRIAVEEQQQAERDDEELI